MKRRAVLAASGTTLSVLSAGCSRVVPTDEGDDNDADERSYAFRLYNGSTAPHSFGIRIGNEVSETWFYDDTIDLNAESAAEERRLEATPSRIFVTVDSEGEREFPWPASTAELGTAARTAEIWYEPAQDQEFFIYGDA